MQNPPDPLEVPQLSEGKGKTGSSGEGAEDSVPSKKHTILILTVTPFIFFMVFLSYFSVQVGKVQNERYFVLAAIKAITNNLSFIKSSHTGSPQRCLGLTQDGFCTPEARYHAILTSLATLQRYPQVTRSLLTETYPFTSIADEYYYRLMEFTRPIYSLSVDKDGKTSEPQKKVMPFGVTYSDQEVQAFWGRPENKFMLNLLKKQSEVYFTHAKEYAWLREKVLEPATNYEKLKQAEQQQDKFWSQGIKLPVIDLSIATLSLNLVTAFPIGVLLGLFVYLMPLKPVPSSIQSDHDLKLNRRWAVGLAIGWGVNAILLCWLAEEPATWYLETHPTDIMIQQPLWKMSSLVGIGYLVAGLGLLYLTFVYKKRLFKTGWLGLVAVVQFTIAWLSFCLAMWSAARGVGFEVSYLSGTFKRMACGLIFAGLWGLNLKVLFDINLAKSEVDEEAQVAKASRA